MSDGYVRVKVNGKLRLRHVLVWEAEHGPVPPGFRLDHKDSTPGNDWLDNLQLVTHADNMALGTPRLIKRNTSGRNGVDWKKSHGKWRARCQHHGKSVTVGYFDTPEQASDARIAYQKQHGLTISRRGLLSTSLEEPQ